MYEFHNYRTPVSADAILVILTCYFHMRGHAVSQWLRHCATNRKVAGWNPDCVNGIFH
jgi:hypothetical protein